MPESPGHSGLVLGVFSEEEDILEATAATRSAGHSIHDVFTPYPVHGLDRAMGLRRSRFTWVCLGFALMGLTVAVLGQFWISAIDWPLNVGGKPWNSLPAFLPIMFELTVLFGGVGVFLTLLFRIRLWPGKTPRVPHIRATDDSFVLAVDANADPEVAERLGRLWEPFHLVEMVCEPARSATEVPR